MEREELGTPQHGQDAPGTAAVRALEEAVFVRPRIDRLRMPRVEHERAHVCALKAGGAPAGAAVRALDDALFVRSRVDRLRMLGVERQRGHVRAFQADRVPVCPAVAALEDATPMVDRRRACGCAYRTRVDRVGIARVEGKRVHRPETDASPARPPVRGLEDPLLPRARVDDVGIATIDDECVDVALVEAVLAPLRRLLCGEKVGARGLPARADLLPAKETAER